MDYNIYVIVSNGNFFVKINSCKILVHRMDHRLSRVECSLFVLKLKLAPTSCDIAIM